MKYTEEFAKKNKDKGKVVKETDFSFTWETNPDKNGNTEQITYMESYFTDMDRDR